MMMTQYLKRDTYASLLSMPNGKGQIAERVGAAAETDLS